MKSLFIILTTTFSMLSMAQDNTLPYYEIPEHPVTYTAGNVASRMVDGLGFRYFWATEGLRPEDLSYKASENGRTSQNTMQHVFELSLFILNTISDEKISDVTETDYESIRKQTLLNFKKASDILRETDNLSEFDNAKFPFWNIINGPIADAIWHCGQVVMLRRASGNPFNSKASVFTGKVRE